MDIENLKDVLTQTKDYVSEASRLAETKHDENGEYVTDGEQYALMMEANELIHRIDDILEELD